MPLHLQPRIARAFAPLLVPKRFKGAKGGRGSGKSRFFAALAVMEMASGHQRVVAGREVQKSIDDSSKRLVEDEIRRNGIDSLFRITDNEITCPSTESLMVFRGLRSHTVSSIKSMEGFTRLWLEEAQTISQTSLDVAIPTFRAGGSQIWASWNPKKATDPIDRFFLENADDPEFVCVEVNYYDNPWFPDELRRDMERDKRRDPDKYAHIWLGQYERKSSARVFRNWRVEEFEGKPGGRYYFGADWGFSVDPTVLIQSFVEGQTIYVEREAYRVGCEIDRTPEMFDTIDPDNIGFARKWPIRADSARPETISYMQRHGYPHIEPAVKGAGSVEDGIEFLKSYNIVVHPRCTHTIDELSTYSYKTDPLTGEVVPLLEDKNNHLIDALRYSLEAVRKGRGPMIISPDVIENSRRMRIR